MKSISEQVDDNTTKIEKQQREIETCKEDIKTLKEGVVENAEDIANVDGAVFASPCSQPP